MSGKEFQLKVGEDLRAQRVDLGLTQQEIAEAVGCSDSAISRWETGEANMSAATFARLKAFFRTERTERNRNRKIAHHAAMKVTQ